ncbi:MAG TPA: hypothetical protein VGW40_04805 [Allosphingosinicella sp.]|nr:hypothetical protein [Allosphingosinicella sp.]
MKSRTLAALAALSLAGVGGPAAAQSAAPLSLARSPALARAGAGLDGASALRGPARWIVGAVVLGLVIWGIIELLGDDEEAFPVSP